MGDARAIPACARNNRTNVRTEVRSPGGRLPVDEEASLLSRALKARLQEISAFAAHAGR